MADLLAADYVGAVLAGVAFPFLLLPLLGQIQTALVAGARQRGLAGLVVLWLLGRTRQAPASAAGGLRRLGVLLALAGAAAVSGRFEVSARQRAVRRSDRAHRAYAYQEIVLTE